MKSKVGIFNQPKKPLGPGKKKPSAPWDFKPSDYDQRAAPSPASGDYYGSGIKAKVGKLRDTSGPGANPVPLSKLHKPPKSLA